eukprot:77421-Hanusia_phi.AAC.1
MDQVELTAPPLAAVTWPSDKELGFQAFLVESTHTSLLPPLLEHLSDMAVAQLVRAQVEHQRGFPTRRHHAAVEGGAIHGPVRCRGGGGKS